MASGWYNRGKFHIIGGTVNLTSDTIKVMLVSSAYTFSPDHNFVSDVSADEISVTGYTGGFAGAGRKTLSAKTFTEDDANDWAYLDADDIVWNTLGAGATIGGAILIKEVTNDAASPLLAFMDLTNTSTNGGDITVSWNASGIMRIA